MIFQWQGIKIIFLKIHKLVLELSIAQLKLELMFGPSERERERKNIK